MLKQGSKGDAVRQLQTKLAQLGFDLKADGDFGTGTDTVVRKFQTMFGYTVDGIVGPGTEGLIDAQIGYGWNVKSPDAEANAKASNPGAAAPATAKAAAPATAKAAAPAANQNAPKKA